MKTDENGPESPQEQRSAPPTRSAPSKAPRRSPAIVAPRKVYQGMPAVLQLATVAAIAGLAVLHPAPITTLAKGAANVLQTVVRGT